MSGQEGGEGDTNKYTKIDMPLIRYLGVPNRTMAEGRLLFLRTITKEHGTISFTGPFDASLMRLTNRLELRGPFWSIAEWEYEGGNRRQRRGSRPRHEKKRR